MTSDDAISLWDRSAAEPDHLAPLEGDARADVIVVGAGYTGLSAALFCARRGLSVHVVEARRIGHGGSGRNVGLVNAGLWLPPQEVRARLGEARGRALLHLLGEMPERVFALIRECGMDCGAVRHGTIHAAHSPRGLRGLERRAEGWRALGVELALLSAGEVAERTGTGRFFGGLFDHRAGTVNPMGYARGLARAARAAGARISVRSPVRRIERQGDGWVAISDRGTVTAAKVALCTNAYSGPLWPALRRSFTMIPFFQLATVPLGERAAHVLPGGEGLWDTAPIMFSLRRDEAGRLVIGSMGSVLGARAGLSRRWAARRLRALFPGLGVPGFEQAWHGRIAMTRDHLFRIFRLAPGIYAPAGYNGRGITTGTLMGEALARLFADGDEGALPVPVTVPRGDPLRLARTGVLHTVFAVNQILGAAGPVGALPPLLPGAGSDAGGAERGEDCP